MLFYRTVRELEELLSGTNTAHPLDVAALQLATVEQEDVDPAQVLDVLDGYAEELRERVDPQADGVAFVHAANDLLFGELGFRGNDRDYYSARNSCLNCVVADRTGIPITLSLVYMEVARRLARPVFGIGLPGHFVVQYDDGAFSSYVDVFRGGVLMNAAECAEVALERSGVDIRTRPEFLRPFTKKQILVRMLANLRGVYFADRSFEKAIRVLDLLILAEPNSAEEYKQRGVLLVHSRRFRNAAADLEAYLRLAVKPSDRDEVVRQLEAIHGWLARLN